MEIFYSIFWIVVCYLYAENVKKEIPELDVNPFNYIIGGFLFGIFSLAWCWNKRRQFKKYNK